MDCPHCGKTITIMEEGETCPYCNQVVYPIGSTSIMKESTRDNIIQMAVFSGTIMLIAGGFGVALSLVEGVEKAVLSIPFWVVGFICYSFAFLINRKEKSSI